MGAISETESERTRLEDRPVFRSDVVTIGVFRAGVEHPSFTDTGPTTAPLFVFPRTGVIIEQEGRGRFTADPSVATYYNAGQAYRRYPVDPRGDICEWFAVRPAIIAEVLADHHQAAPGGDDTLFPFTNGPVDAATYALQRQLYRYVTRSTFVETMAVEEKVLEILDVLVGLATRRPRAAARDAAGDHARAEGVRRMLLEDFRSRRTLNEIADDAGVSVFHLCRLFKARFGTTIHQFRHQLRLRRSLDLISDPESDISRVALHLGFSSHSHYSAAFKRAFAVTPSQFRRAPTVRRLRTFPSPVAGVR